MTTSTYRIQFRATVHILGYTCSTLVLRDAKPLDGKDDACAPTGKTPACQRGSVLAEATDTFADQPRAGQGVKCSCCACDIHG